MQTLELLGERVFGLKYPRERDRKFNPRGFFEWPDFLNADYSILTPNEIADGIAVKTDIVKLMRLKPLPIGARIIVANRPTNAIVKSQAKMGIGSKDPDRAAAYIDRVKARVNSWKRNKNILIVSYPDLMSDPAGQVAAIQAFIGNTADPAAAIANLKP